MFNLVGRAIAEWGVATVQVEVVVEVPGDLPAGFFQRGKGSVAGEAFGFERAPARFSLGIVVGIAGLADAGQSARLVDAGWRSVRACSRARSTSSVGICAARCQPTTRREQVLRQVAR